MTKEVQDAFDKMLKMPVEGQPGVVSGISDAAKKKVSKIIGALRDRYNNAPNYVEKATIKADSLTPEVLSRILGDSFLGQKKATREGFESFSKLFSNTIADTGSGKFEATDPSDIMVGQKVEHETFGMGTITDLTEQRGEKAATVRFENGDTKTIVLRFGKMRVISAPKQVATEDVKSVAMDLSDEMWEVLSKIDHPVCIAFVECVRSTRRGKAQNVLAIRDLDVDKSRPDLMKATMVNGKRTTIPAFNLLKQYLGAKFDNLLLDEFVREYTKVVTIASHESGTVIRPPKFQFSPKDVRSTFISLVTETYPKGHEDEVVKYLGPGLTRDKHGNYYKVIGTSDTMFASHLDTVSTKSKVTLMSRMKDNDEIISSDGTTILGADDKAGVTVLLYMMAHSVPGVYYFFVGEESGGIGSGKVADEFRATPHLRGIKKCVSFDRKNYFSVITQQMYDDCCSEEFATALCQEFRRLGLSMNPDPTGVFTDSANFVEHVPECTNVSVGYFNEHTRTEALNVSFLERLAKACVQVNWRELPVSRGVGMDESLYEHWGDVLIALDDTGFHNEIKLRGSRSTLTVSLALDTTSFGEIYTDVQNLYYLFRSLRLDAKVTFGFDLIKFELQS